MTTLRRFRATDLLRVNNVNLDHLTETFNMPFYNHYLVTWPELCQVAQGPSQTVAGYMIGKVEGEGDQWHGHVSAVTIAPSYRRLGLAKQLMDDLEKISDKVYVEIIFSTHHTRACVVVLHLHVDILLIPLLALLTLKTPYYHHLSYYSDITLILSTCMSARQTMWLYKCINV